MRGMVANRKKRLGDGQNGAPPPISELGQDGSRTTKTLAEDHGRIKHAILRNEPISVSINYQWINFICRNLCRLQRCLQMGSFWKNEAISSVFASASTRLAPVRRSEGEGGSRSARLAPLSSPELRPSGRRHFTTPFATGRRRVASRPTRLRCCPRTSILRNEPDWFWYGNRG